MSMTDTEEERPQEIIIVRRGGDDEDEAHHGGVWKIAFADFMTAMMCFFLVMWLINAANEQTRSALASYFNPVKLIDRNTSRKGLEDLGNGPHTAKSSEVKSTNPDDKPANANDTEADESANLSGSSRDISDEKLFADPYAVLAEIAANTGNKQNTSDKGAGGASDAGPATGASGGESYRDPFAPDFWTQQVAVPRDGVDGSPDEARQDPFGGDVKADETGAFALGSQTPPDDDSKVEAARTDLDSIGEVQPLAKAPDEAAAPEKDTEAKDALPETETAEPAPAEEARRARSEAVAGEIRAELSQAFKGDRMGAGISVSATPDGVRIAVADDLEHGMFAVGSAVPRKELVLGMEKIARTLNDRPGQLEIQGHTDGRPFSSGDYDNWRLSSARAQAAYYMLVRGGVDEKRVTEVSGFADRALKVADDPFAAANRRIELLLEVPE